MRSSNFTHCTLISILGFSFANLLYVRMLQLRGEFSLCRLYTKSGSLRQFDRRPLAATGGVVVPGEDPAGPFTAVAASPPDDDDGSGSSMQQQQQQLTGGGANNDPYGDGVVTEREDAHDPFGDDVAMLDALLYWPGD